MRTAIYCRVSTAQQNTAGQEADLRRWCEMNITPDHPTPVWYHDSWTGTTMVRPGFQEMMQAVHAGKIDQIVVWRIDRLGRTASGLSALFEELQRLRVNLVSMKDSIDLSTPGGRLVANMIASVAAYETEVRAERVLAGMAAAMAVYRCKNCKHEFKSASRTPHCPKCSGDDLMVIKSGSKWGGRVKGALCHMPDAVGRSIVQMHNAGVTYRDISGVVKMSRYRVRNYLMSVGITPIDGKPGRPKGRKNIGHTFKT